MLDLTEALYNLLYLIIALIILLIINTWFVRETSVWFKLKDRSFLTGFDISTIFIILLFVWSILPNIVSLKWIWAIITFGAMYYTFLKFYELDWKEALKLYSVWLVFILLIALGVTKLA